MADIDTNDADTQEDCDEMNCDWTEQVKHESIKIETYQWNDIREAADKVIGHLNTEAGADGCRMCGFDVRILQDLIDDINKVNRVELCPGCGKPYGDGGCPL